MSIGHKFVNGLTDLLIFRFNEDVLQMACRTERKAILVSLITQGIITADNVLPTAFLCNIFFCAKLCIFKCGIIYTEI